MHGAGSQDYPSPNCAASKAGSPRRHYSSSYHDVPTELLVRKAHELLVPPSPKRGDGPACPVIVLRL
ncbi:uncharacterized protein SETTUDRAFT_166897, partial [Exserohilum turcica Et28A]